ncbi:CpXC domain-containing protein [Butyricicoccus faecihominis]|uniref:CpXC domain-containing protein n=1 Tax=Butyricicoccus faecihominis TaxID=1712515 RepID=UPI002479F1BC|nr:CpXC domain-containing protein [Butyricicoccus faecihominis]
MRKKGLFRMTVQCPHCHEESEHKVIDHINIDRTPEMREKVRDLSLFRVKCPNCGETVLAVHPCLYHDMSNGFMVWLWNEEEPVPTADFDPLAGYKLREVETMNAFREKIAVLELGLDDRAVEIMKLLLLMRLRHDLDVVELVFHELDARTGDFRFVAVLSDGVEQYAAMPGALYQRLKQDVEERLFTSAKNFTRVDMDWAAQALELLHEAE